MTKRIQVQTQMIYFSMLVLYKLCILHLHIQQQISRWDCALSSEEDQSY